MSYFEELESTNSYTKKQDTDQVNHGMLCLTNYQTEGNGQYQRNWESEPGKNLTFSMVFRPQAAERLHVLTLSFALAVVEHLEEITGEESTASIKWPNDVMLNDKKVAGLLTESVFNGNKLDRLVIGIGLNVNQKKFSDEISDKTTSVSLEAGKNIDRECLLCDLLNRIEYKYNLWDRHQTKLLKAINRRINGYGKWVGLQVDGELKNDPYKMLGVNEKGQLLMLNEDRGIESFSYEQVRIVTD